MTVKDILSDLRWHRITEVVAIEQLEQIVAEAREKAVNLSIEIVKHGFEMTDARDKAVKNILKLKETK
jgi:UDP-N-acetyl-D-mannosaminuronic acid transferase (WecB/TagA/CpsF family)